MGAAGLEPGASRVSSDSARHLKSPLVPANPARQRSAPMGGWPRAMQAGEAALDVASAGCLRCCGALRAVAAGVARRPIPVEPAQRFRTAGNGAAGGELAALSPR